MIMDLEILVKLKQVYYNSVISNIYVIILLFNV